ncbi:MAG: HEAT repeat domain-containing protein [Victivallales bacterium]|nr:HEAT repeat domain-containing protein [Victivallales bacterium]
MTSKTFWTLMLCMAMIAVQVHGEDGGTVKRETEDQTIAKCLRDLKSDDVEARRRAAMVIGKYQTPDAEAAVIQCLRDPDRQVRQSALVSLTEERFLPTKARMDIFRLLRDPDVHIRRLASSMLPEASGVMVRGPIQVDGNVVIRSGGGRSEADNAEVMGILNEALDDSDFSVRRNVLAAARYFPQPLESSRMEKFFHDESAEVRVLALTLYNRSLNMDAAHAIAAVAPLVEDPEPPVRQEVARFAHRLGKPGDELLKKLLDDKDIAVKVEAIRAYANHLNDNAFDPLAKLILDENVPADYRRLLLPPLRDFGERSFPVYESLLNGRNATLAAYAMNVLAIDRSKRFPPSFFIKFLDSPHDDVRKGAIRALNIMSRDLKGDDICQIMKSKSHDGKILGLRMCSRLDREERIQILQDACLDDDEDVRTLGLHELGILRPDGWTELLLASLEDPSEQIRQTAAEGLCNYPTAEIQAALRNYLPNCKDLRTQRMIQRALARRPIPVK